MVKGNEEKNKMTELKTMQRRHEQNVKVSTARSFLKWSNGISDQQRIKRQCIITLGLEIIIKKWSITIIYCSEVNCNM